MTLWRTVRHKSEENLAIAEAELDKQTALVNDMTRKVDELQVKADEAARLKDQMDECVLVAHISRIRTITLTVFQISTCCRPSSEDGKRDGEV